MPQAGLDTGYIQSLKYRRDGYSIDPSSIDPSFNDTVGFPARLQEG